MQADADGLAEWYAARLDEAEAKARTADPGPWHVRNLGRHDLSAVIRKTGETPVSRVPEGPALAQFEGSRAARNALHAAAHDPAWRLRDIAAKRAILGMYAETAAVIEQTANKQGESAAHDYLDATRELCALEPVVRHLATEFADQPGYRDEWRPET